MSWTTCVPALSLGHALDVNLAEVGVVHSVFARAVNLTLRGDLWTLLAEDKADLPFGIRVPWSNFETLGLYRGDRVHVRARFVGIGAAAKKGSGLFCRNGPEGASHKRVPTPFSPPRLVIDCRTTSRWEPARVRKPTPGLDRRISVLATAVSGRSWRYTHRMAQAVKAAVNDPSSLRGVLAQVVGRGPGATPSGDDLLVGALAVLTSPHSAVAGARTAAAVGRAILPLLPTTTEVSGHLLRQALKGLFSRDVHELVSALIGAPSLREVADKARRVLDAGATSGADLCEGLLAFAPGLFTTNEERGSS